LSSARTIWHRIRFSGAAQVNVLLNATHAFFAESEVPRLWWSDAPHSWRCLAMDAPGSRMLN